MKLNENTTYCMILSACNAGKGKTAQNADQGWLTIKVQVGDRLHKGSREPFLVIKMFCILIVVVVT